MNLTIKNIAEKAGVCMATVSRAIRPETSHLVKENTRRKIFAVIRKEGFSPNLAAANLASGVRARAVQRQRRNGADGIGRRADGSQPQYRRCRNVMTWREGHLQQSAVAEMRQPDPGRHGGGTCQLPLRGALGLQVQLVE